MTSQKENEQTEAKTNGASDAKETPAKSSGRRKSSIVKSQDEHEGEIVFVLNDNTRITPTEYLPNHRPIGLSEIEVVGSLDMAGRRPIMANSFEIVETDLLPGHRPIAADNFPLSDLNFLPGNRPIASNDVVDPVPSVLMGYLD